MGLAANSSSSWEETTLGEILTEVNVRASDLSDEQAKAVNVLSLTKDFGLIPQSDRFYKRIATTDVSRYKVVRKGWLVYNPYVLWEGAIHGLKTAEIGLVSPVYHVWQSKRACSGFLDYLLKTPQMLNSYLKVAQGTVKRRRAVRTSAFKMLSVSLPPLLEQGAITKVLDAVQWAKQSRRRELALERERKAALMEYLFTHGTRDAEPTTTEVGQLPVGWEVVALGEVVNITYGIQAAVAHLTDPTRGIPILTNVNIRNDGRLDFTTLRYFPLPERLRERGSLKKGDVLFNWRSGSQEHVGKTALFDVDGEFTYSSFILRLRTSSKVKSLFLSYYLHAIKARGYFVQHRQQSSVNSVFNASVAAEIPLGIPALEEQDEIGAVLRSCDRRIAALEKENELIEELFQATLEELMTGRLSAVPLIEEHQAQ